MLATLVAEPSSRENWIFEPKLDGVRCLVIDSGKTPRLHSRNKRLLNETYPELVAPLARQAVESYIADGRMQLRNPDEARRVGVEVFYYLFDLLYLNGYDLREAPLIHRKALLKEAFYFRDPLRYTEHQERDGEAYYRDAKRANSIYVSRRWRDWLKIKCWEEQEFIVGGFTDPKGGRDRFGRVAARLLRKWRTTLQEIKRSPFAEEVKAGKGVHWVRPRPKLVAQVSFTEWTRDGRLRHPRFLGIRQDQDPREVVRERSL